MKTKEQIKKYSKEYFARPEVIARAKVRNAQPKIKEARRKYRQSKAGKIAMAKYFAKPETKLVLKNNRMKTLYGIGIKDYERMFKKQKGKCAICGAKKDRLDIDHCHKTKKVRGLLCGSCNKALGLMKDNVQFFSNAIKYLL